MSLLFSGINKENIPPQKKWGLSAGAHVVAGINNHPIISTNRAGFEREDAQTKTLTDLSRSEKPLIIEDKQYVIHVPSIRTEPLDVATLRERGPVSLVDASDRDLGAKMLGQALSQNYGVTLGKFLLENLHQDGCKALGQTFLGAQLSTELTTKASCSSADVYLKATKLGVIIIEEFDVKKLTNFSDPENLAEHQNRGGQPLAHVKTISLLTKDPETHEPSLRVLNMTIEGYTNSPQVKDMFVKALRTAVKYEPESPSKGPKIGG